MRSSSRRLRGLCQRAALALEMSANGGITLTEVGVSGAVLRLAVAALEAVVGCGATSASRLEAAAMLRDGWRPGQSMVLLARVDEPIPLRCSSVDAWRIWSVN